MIDSTLLLFVSGETKDLTILKQANVQKNEKHILTMR